MGPGNKSRDDSLCEAGESLSGLRCGPQALQAATSISSGRVKISRLCATPRKLWRPTETRVPGTKRANSSEISTPIPSSLVKASRSEEHTSELQSLMRISYAVFCLKKKTNSNIHHTEPNTSRYK